MEDWVKLPRTDGSPGAAQAEPPPSHLHLPGPPEDYMHEGRIAWLAEYSGESPGPSPPPVSMREGVNRPSFDISRLVEPHP